MFYLVNPDVQPLDVHLRVLGLGLSQLQPLHQVMDLLLVRLLSLVGLLLRHLQRLEIVADHPQLLLQLNDLALSSLCPLIGSLQFRFHAAKLAGNILILPFRLSQHESETKMM